MAREKTTETIKNTAHPHTVKKFELIEEYVKAWAQKLLNFEKCNGIVFIDCMCSSGVYQDDDGNEVVGTPIRVAKYLFDIMTDYPNKQAWCYFNDLSKEKIDILKSRLPDNTANFHIETRTIDGNDLLKSFNIPASMQVHYLLVYDPYEATVDWDALMPFISNWGDVIINHMVSDSIRAVSQVKRASAIAKYEQTYLSSIQELATFGSDRDSYEKRMQQIMVELRGRSNKRYYIASFPFFNTKNSVVYNLLFGSSNIEGFKLFKKTAWKTFGGKSSAKNTYGMEDQLILDFSGNGALSTMTDEYCYYVKDIVKFIHDKFIGQQNVPLSDVWRSLDDHPVFPSDGYKPEIRRGLKDTYGDAVSKQSITFTNRRS